MSSKTLIFCIALIGLAAGVAYYFQAQPTVFVDSPFQNEPANVKPVEETPSVVAKKTSVQAKPIKRKPITPIEKADAQLSESHTQDVLIEPWEVAKTPPSDDEFYRIVEKMRQNPNFLAGVIQEFQGETDPERVKWLAFMLGDLRDKPELTAIAGQMLFSGDKQSTLSALALLSRLQKTDPAARDLVLQSLGTSQDLTVLTASMNALARATPEASYTQKQQILQQLKPLTQHPQAALRRRSYDLLFRWASDAPYISQQLAMGLVDQDASVRRNTAIGFINHPQSDINVKLALMDMLNSSQELDRNRNLAARALQKMKLNPGEELHINAVLKTIR